MSLLTKRGRVSGLGIVAACLVAMPVLGSLNQAKGASLTDGNSSLTLNPTDVGSRYISQWIVDGVDQFGGLSPGGEQLEFSAGNQAGNTILSSLAVKTSNFANGIGSVTYSGNGFDVTVKDILTGGAAGSHASAISETITVDNTGLVLQPTNVQSQGIPSSPLQFSLSKLVNFHVDGMQEGNTLTLTPSSNPNTADQTVPNGAHVNFTVTPTPDSALTQNDDTFTNNNSFGPVTGNEGFRFQWNFSIDPGGSAIVSINQTLTGGTSAASVPLPKSAWSALTMLAGMGAFSVVRRMRRVAV